MTSCAPLLIEWNRRSHVERRISPAVVKWAWGKKTLDAVMQIWKGIPPVVIMWILEGIWSFLGLSIYSFLVGLLLFVSNFPGKVKSFCMHLQRYYTYTPASYRNGSLLSRSLVF